MTWNRHLRKSYLDCIYTEDCIRLKVHLKYLAALGHLHQQVYQDLRVTDVQKLPSKPKIQKQQNHQVYGQT